MGFGEELRLVWFLCLNTVALSSAWRMATVFGGRSLSRRVLDTLLLNYLIEYGIVCGLGACGVLSPATITIVTAVVGIVVFAFTFRRRSGAGGIGQLTSEGRGAMAVLLFGAGYLLLYAFDRRYMPVLETDALAYHLPTAIGWLQSGRLKLFESWYWNPANTYSPLAAEAFMAWLLAPMHSDIFARYVQTPALLIVGLAMYRVGRQLGARPFVAACAALTAMLTRSIFAQTTLVKDDLFVAAFFISAAAGIGEMQNAERRMQSEDRLGPWRVGIALGLLVATKYPALLTLPLLLLLTDVPIRRWTRRQWLIVIGVIVLLAGPWFARNWIEFGNPLFPMILKVGRWTVFDGIFNVTRSASTRTPTAIWKMISSGYFGTPALFLLVLIAAWAAGAIGWFAILRSRAACDERSRVVSARVSRPMLRFAIWGPMIGPIVFSIASPHPEIRYFFPFLLPLFVGVVVGLNLLTPWPKLQIVAALSLSIGATMTSFRLDFVSSIAGFSTAGVIVAAIGWFAAVTWARWRRALTYIAAVLILALALIAYINWQAYTSDVLAAAWPIWSDFNGDDVVNAWLAVRDTVPPDATLAYANTYFVYPLYGPHYQRRVVYAPVRQGEMTFADLPRLGDHVPQDRIVETVTAAMNDGSDEAVWLENLHRLGVSYIFIAKHERTADPPEWHFIQKHRTFFDKTFENDVAAIYRVLPQAN